jgi:hypothetical protein
MLPKDVMAEDLTKKVAERYQEKTAMAVVIRNVARHNWGWFSREDPRMHLQTVDEDSLRGPSKVKVWLESKGKRVFELAEGQISGPDLKKLRDRVETERENIEDRWANFMYQNGWLKYQLNGSTLTLTAYPGGHNSFTRTVDLGKEYPGMDWDRAPMYVDFDVTTGALLAVGPENNMDARIHIPTSVILWGNGKW